MKYIKLNLIMLVAVVLLNLLSVQPLPAQQILPCPAVDPVSGTRPQLNPDVKIFPEELPGDRKIDEEIKKKALDVIGFFEANGEDPWSNVNYTDTLSLGFMQWNWGTGSLITVFMASTGPEEIALADVNIQNDLKILKSYADSNTPENKEKAVEVIKDWTDVAKKARLNAWLQTEAMKKVQQKIIVKNIEEAFFYARAWLRDSKSKTKIDARTVAYFFDLVTFNGGTQGLWIEHVKKYRSKYSNKKETVNGVSNWLLSCNDFISPTNTRYKKLYTLKDTTRSAEYWKSRITENENAFDENQINLLVLGLLRAQLSNGDDAPRAFHGVFQADVLNRRGVIAVGGYARGKAEVISPF